jgi:hypothetical protein
MTPLVLLAGVASAVVLSLSMTNTLSAFTAAITNSVNTAASGTYVLQETGPSGGATVTCNSTDGGTVSTNAATCATINKYGGSTTMVPTNAAGTSNLVTTTVTFRNTGTATPSTFTLTPGACTQGTNGTSNGTATDFCSKLNVAISANGTTVRTATAAALATGGAIPLPNIPAPGGAAVTYVFTVSIDTSAGNTYQGLSASQPLTWTLSS